MPNHESFNSDRSRSEASRANNQNRGRTTINAARGYDTSKDISNLSEEERKKLVNDALDAIFGPSGNSTSVPPSHESSRNPESRPSRGEIQSTKEKAKRNSGLKGFIAGATVIAVAAGMGLAYGHLASRSNNNTQNLAPTPDPEPQTEWNFQAPETPSDYEAYDLGIYDGYNEPGMFTSENKTSSVAFADAGEVAEICNNDECEMIKYTAHNQVESFADYMANLPEQLQPEGFKGLSLKETEAKLESLSDEEFTLVENQFRNTIDNAFTRRVVKNGTFHNAFMRHKGGDFVHENMELVQCTTNETNLEVTEFYWVDQNGNEIGTMDVKIIPVRDKDGNIVGFKGCEQVINPYGDIYVMLPDIPPENPDKPTPEPDKPTPEPDKPTPEPDKPTPEPDKPTPEPDKPTPEPDKPTPEPTPLATKNTEAEKEHAGDRVDVRELDEEITPATDIEEDQENFEAIEEQKQEVAERQAEAERVATEQAEAERQAAEEAEARRQAEAATEAERQAEAERQRLANEAAAKAQAEAEEAQRQAAEAERQAAEEQAAREQAQAEADAQAETNNQEAESRADATAEERAEMFENGDF